jgi:hypothetical protein
MEVDKVEFLPGDYLFDSRGKVQRDRDTNYRLATGDRERPADRDKSVTEICNMSGCRRDNPDIVA